MDRSCSRGPRARKSIARLVESYAKRPPSEMLGTKVVSVRDFEKETIRDVEGDLIPKEKMSIFELEDRTRVAVRASGTEPKIKYYLFAQRRPETGKFEPAELASDQEGSRRPPRTAVGMAATGRTQPVRGKVE